MEHVSHVGAFLHHLLRLDLSDFHVVKVVGDPVSLVLCLGDDGALGGLRGL